MASRQTPRCGCCDYPQTLALCEDCGEPTCAKHLVRVGEIGAPAYVCVICEREREERDAAATPAPAVPETLTHV